MSYKPNKGDILLNKYEIVSLVGEGAFGCVYRARFLKLDRFVAIKFINPNNQVFARFMDELDAIKKLDHPNIVRLYDFDILQGGTPCIVMEFVNGREVGDVLASEGAFDCQAICEIALQVVDALVETHKQGIIHCDLKPENIMLTSVGARKNVVKLIDFGVASILAKANENNERQHMLIGTPQYMAPEQILHDPLGPWTDIYAFGLILIELFTGKFVFDSDDPREVLHMQLYSPVEIPHALACTPLGDIISRATEKDVAKRYNNTQEFYDDLCEASSSIQSAVRQLPMGGNASWRRNRTVHSIFTDINDLLIPTSGNTAKTPRQKVSSSTNPTRAIRRTPSVDVPLMDPNNNALNSKNNSNPQNSKNNSNSQNAPADSSGDFDVSVLNLDSFQNSLSILLPQNFKQTNFQNSNLQERRPTFDVPSLNLAPNDDSSPNHSNSDVEKTSNSSPKIETQTSSSEANHKIENSSITSIKSDLGSESSKDLSFDSSLERIENAVLSSQLKKSSPAPTAIDANLASATHSFLTRQIEPKTVSNFWRNTIIVSLVVLAIIGVSGYLWTSGRLVQWGLLKPANPEIVRNSDDDNTPKNAFVQYSTMRDTADQMAYVAAISGYLGASPETAKTTEYRIIGTPTDASIYLNSSPVCTKTPCKILVFGKIENMKLEIRKNKQTSAFEMPPKLDPQAPIILVLK